MPVPQVNTLPLAGAESSAAMHALCHVPHAIASTTSFSRAPRTIAGLTVCSVAFKTPCPSLPPSLHPQEYTLPSLESAIECSAPHATCRTLIVRSSSTWCITNGFGNDTLEPFIVPLQALFLAVASLPLPLLLLLAVPSCPDALLPQQNVTPSCPATSSHTAIV